MQSALGEYELDAADPARQNVYFTGIRIEPSSSDPAAVKAWVALLRESNPSMVRLATEGVVCQVHSLGANGRVTCAEYE